jgi:hypothetical protein
MNIRTLREHQYVTCAPQYELLQYKAELCLVSCLQKVPLNKLRRAVLDSEGVKNAGLVAERVTEWRSGYRQCECTQNQLGSMPL